MAAIEAAGDKGRPTCCGEKNLREAPSAAFRYGEALIRIHGHPQTSPARKIWDDGSGRRSGRGWVQLRPASTQRAATVRIWAHSLHRMSQSSI
jgi:hypothetical protein